MQKKYEMSSAQSHPLTRRWVIFHFQGVAVGWTPTLELLATTELRQKSFVPQSVPTEVVEILEFLVLSNICCQILSFSMLTRVMHVGADCQFQTLDISLCAGWAKEAIYNFGTEDDGTHVNSESVPFYQVNWHREMTHFVATHEAEPLDSSEERRDIRVSRIDNCVWLKLNLIRSPAGTDVSSSQTCLHGFLNVNLR